MPWETLGSPREMGGQDRGGLPVGQALFPLHRSPSSREPLEGIPHRVGYSLPLVLAVPLPCIWKWEGAGLIGDIWEGRRNYQVPTRPPSGIRAPAAGGQRGEAQDR